MSDNLAVSDGGRNPITHSQVVTINHGPKAYQQHLTLSWAALIHGHTFEETSFMVISSSKQVPPDTLSQI